MIVLDSYGWPVERIRGRWFSYLIRCLIHGRKVISRAEWQRQQALDQQEWQRQQALDQQSCDVWVKQCQ